MLSLDRSYDPHFSSVCCTPYIFDELLLIEGSSFSTIAESISMQSLEFNDTMLYSLFMKRHIILSIFVTLVIYMFTLVIILFSSSYLLCRCCYSFMCMKLID